MRRLPAPPAAPPETGELAGLRSEAGLRHAYASHAAALYRYALRCLHDTAAAEDAVAETFVRAWRAAERYDPHQTGLQTWLLAITRHVVIDAVRRGVGPLADPSETVERQWAMGEALRRLPAAQRAAVVETFLRGRPAAEVATEQQVSIGAVREHLFYALRSLNVLLRELGVEP